ncbi:transglycosylase, partial [Gammaproteobacteria bacterium]|nr:transglycosylase [Gammaproteobacteria bacterium]
RANRKDFKDSADFIGWYASKGYYQGFEKLDARSLYLAYHEGYGGFKKKSYRKKPWLIKVADRVQTRSTKYQQQYWGCAKQLKKKRFIFF